MRVALYENLPSGGAKRAAYELVRALSTNGHMVDWWTTTAADESFLPLGPVTNRKVCYPWPAHARPGRWPGLRGYVDAASTTQRLQCIAQLARRIAAEIDQGHYDFAFVHNCQQQPVPAPYVLRYLRTPTVYFCQEPWRIMYDPPIERPRRLVDRLQRLWYTPANGTVTWLTKRADRANVRAATMILANSYFSAEALYRAYQRQAFVSYLGVDTSVFRPLGLSRQEYVLSVGAISPHKGYDFLIEALGGMTQTQRPPLVIVGNVGLPQERHYLVGLARERGVSLEIRENVTEEELVAVYNQARVLAYAPVLEPFGFAPLEAMACGTPVVAVAEGGVRETVRDGETGLLTVREAGRFAVAVQRVLADEELQRRLGSAGVDAVRSAWTWDAAYNRFSTLVQTSLHKGAE